MKRLPDAWVMSLFDKFGAIYGEKFARQWDGVKPDELRDMWADALGQFDGERIKWALLHVRSNNPFPPTLPEFVQVCRQAPRKEHEAIAAPVVDPETARSRAKEAAQAAKKLVGRQDHHSWAKTPPRPGSRGAWENLLISAAESSEVFRGYLAEHVKSGVVTSERARALIDGPSE